MLQRRALARISTSRTKQRIKSSHFPDTNTEKNIDKNTDTNVDALVDAAETRISTDQHQQEQDNTDTNTEKNTDTNTDTSVIHSWMLQRRALARISTSTSRTKQRTKSSHSPDTNMNSDKNVAFLSFISVCLFQTNLLPRNSAF